MVAKDVWKSIHDFDDVLRVPAVLRDVPRLLEERAGAGLYTATEEFNKAMGVFRSRIVAADGSGVEWEIQQAGADAIIKREGFGWRDFAPHDRAADKIAKDAADMIMGPGQVRTRTTRLGAEVAELTGKSGAVYETSVWRGIWSCKIRR